MKTHANTMMIVAAMFLLSSMLTSKGVAEGANMIRHRNTGRVVEASSPDVAAAAASHTNQEQNAMELGMADAVEEEKERDHYFRHLVQSSTSMADECPSATLYYSTAIDNTIGSPHIVLRFPGATPLGDGQERLCDPAGINCIGDTHTNFVTLYSDRGLTNQVATIASTAKVVNIKEDGERIYVVTASILYDDTNNELNYGGYFIEEEFNLSEEPHDMPVSGGTLDCAMNFGTIDFSHEPDATYGSVEFHIVDMNN